MICGDGGFVHRLMPPVDWDCGPVPEACYDQELSSREIANILCSVYLEPERVRRLADSGDEMELLSARLALKLLADIDADTIWALNIVNKGTK